MIPTRPGRVGSTTSRSRLTSSTQRSARRRSRRPRARRARRRLQREARRSPAQGRPPAGSCIASSDGLLCRFGRSLSASLDAGTRLLRAERSCREPAPVRPEIVLGRREGGARSYAPSPVKPAARGRLRQCRCVASAAATERRTARRTREIAQDDWLTATSPGAEHRLQARGEDDVPFDAAAPGGHGGHSVLNAGHHPDPLREAEVDRHRRLQRRRLD
jgi:hypothetical protein